jgi:uncharacterized membrane protein YphA (DoxX/SURF4 family)
MTPSKTNSLTQVGRYMFALTFVMGGLLHVTGPQYAASQVPKMFGAPVFWVYVTGIAQLALAVSIVARRLDRLAAIGLFVMMLVFIASIHIPRAIAGDFLGVISVMRDFGYAGAALLYAGAVASDTRMTPRIAGAGPKEETSA